MSGNSKFTKLYLKYIVKSQAIFYLYVGFFAVLFVIVSSRISLQVRSNYEAVVNGNVIEVVTDTEIDFQDDKIYVYTDKNQRVLPLSVSSAEYQEGIMYCVVEDMQEAVNGEVSVEITTGSKSLFQAIFSKAGINK